ncbi:uncharacterized protein AAEQ78_018565 [Lycaon pictus]
MSAAAGSSVVADAVLPLARAVAVEGEALGDEAVDGGQREAAARGVRQGHGDERDALCQRSGKTEMKRLLICWGDGHTFTTMRERHRRGPVLSARLAEPKEPRQEKIFPQYAFSTLLDIKVQRRDAPKVPEQAPGDNDDNPVLSSQGLTSGR